MADRQGGGVERGAAVAAASPGLTRRARPTATATTGPLIGAEYMARITLTRRWRAQPTRTGRQCRSSCRSTGRARRRRPRSTRSARSTSTPATRSSSSTTPAPARCRRARAWPWSRTRSSRRTTRATSGGRGGDGEWLLFVDADCRPRPTSSRATSPGRSPTALRGGHRRGRGRAPPGLARRPVRALARAPRPAAALGVPLPAVGRDGQPARAPRGVGGRRRLPRGHPLGRRHRVLVAAAGRGLDAGLPPGGGRRARAPRVGARARPAGRALRRGPRVGHAPLPGLVERPRSCGGSRAASPGSAWWTLRGQRERATFKALDAVYVVSEWAAFCSPTRRRAPRPRAARGRVVAVAGAFPDRADGSAVAAGPRAGARAGRGAGAAGPRRPRRGPRAARSPTPRTTARCAGSPPRRGCSPGARARRSRTWPRGAGRGCWRSPRRRAGSPAVRTRCAASTRARGRRRTRSRHGPARGMAEDVRVLRLSPLLDWREVEPPADGPVAVGGMAAQVARQAGATATLGVAQTVLALPAGGRGAGASASRGCAPWAATAAASTARTSPGWPPCSSGCRSRAGTTTSSTCTPAASSSRWSPRSPLGW